MKQKIPHFLLSLFFVITTYSQKQHEAGIVIDNDLFTSTVNDKYYTNGIEIFYRFLNRHQSEKVNKKITEFRVGQYIYNPFTVEAPVAQNQDRPFAGYLFAEAGIHTFYQSESVFKWSGQIGIVGASSKAQEIQESIHRFLGYRDVAGWEFQIRNAIALQANLFYSAKIFPTPEPQKIDFHFLGKADLGTVLNGVSIGPLARFSLKNLLPVYDSNLYDGSLNKDISTYKSQSEFYFFINPILNYQIFDATIQGSLFNNDSPVIFDLIPLRFNGEAGFKYRKNHWNLGYSFVYKGKEVDNSKNEGYFYGSISASYVLY